MTLPIQERAGSAESGPWLGLESYRETDANRFFGRETETSELLRRVRREVLTIVFGPSGIGKTSLLRAGLFVRLMEEDYLPIYIRPSYRDGSPPVAEQVLASIRQTLDNRKVEEQFSGKPAGTLWEYLHSVELWDRNNRLLTPVLFFDQFEEVFTLGRGTAAAETFLTNLADVVENYLPADVCRASEAEGKLPDSYRRQNYKAVISLREDYVHKLDALRKRMPSIMQNRYQLAQLNGDQAFDAVAKPGQGIVTEEVARHIVRFVAASSKDAGAAEGANDMADLRVDPALLSVVCQQLYVRARASKQATITAVAVDAARTDILDSFYERSFEGLPPHARIFVEDRLLTQSGFRNTAPLEDATREGLDSGAVTALIDRRLIRTEPRLGIPHLELTHDLLARVVERSRTTRQERERRIAAEHARERQGRTLRWVFLSLLFCVALAVVSVFSWWRASVSANRAKTMQQLAEEAQARAKIAEQTAQTRVAVEYLHQQLDQAKSQGNQTEADQYSSQIDKLEKEVAEFTAKARLKAAAVQATFNIQPQNAARSLEATQRPDTALTGSKIDDAKFITAYATAIRAVSDKTALTNILHLLNDDRAIADIRWAAYVLATIQWESGLSWSTSASPGAATAFARYEPGTDLGHDLGNTEAGDGYRYRGRGYVFLTGKGNYRSFGRLLGLNDTLVENPDLVLDPLISYRIVSEGMVKGWFPGGRKLKDFISGDSADYVNARRIIRGLDHALDIAQSATKIEQVLTSSLVPR